MAAPFNGRVVPFENIYDVAPEADIVITSTGAPNHLFRKEHGQAFLHKRKNRPMFFIDIAVPRDVDPTMNKIDGLFVYDVDDLQQVAASHLEERSKEAADAEALVASEVERFHQRQRTVNVAPAIVALQHQAEELRQAEMRRIHARLGSLNNEQMAAVETLTRGLVNKFLHAPMQALKQAARENDAVRLEAVCETYSLPRSAERAEPQAIDAGQANPEAKPQEDVPLSHTSVAGRK